MQKEGRELVDEIGQIELLPGDFPLLIEILQHDIGRHAGDERRRERGAAAVPQPAETEQGPGEHGEGAGPAGRLHHLADQQTSRDGEHQLPERLDQPREDVTAAQVRDPIQAGQQNNG